MEESKLWEDSLQTMSLYALYTKKRDIEPIRDEYTRQSKKKHSNICHVKIQMYPGGKGP